MRSKNLYYTALGQAVVAESCSYLQGMDHGSVDLCITSPPFALLRQKEYGNESQDQYVDWLLSFAKALKPVLRETGSFVIDLGGAYQKGYPTRSIHNFKFLVRMVEDEGWHLCEEFFWHNPSKLPSPIEWVNKRKIRAKDSVNTIWWFSKTAFPKADVSKVLVPYSARMKKLLKDASSYYTPDHRPSGHNISSKFDQDNGGAIPSNLLEIANTESSSRYLALCKALSIEAHPARFPRKLPEFFIRMLTDESDVVLDIFAGSNTTGFVAEQLGRRWISIDRRHDYLANSAIRFIENADRSCVEEILDELRTSPERALELSEQHLFH